MISDSDQLIAVLALLYLADCLRWCRRGVVGLRAFAGRRFRATLASRAVGNARAGLLWANPLPPLGTLAAVEPWPVALSGEGLATVEPLELDRGPREVFTPLAKRWSEIERVAARGKALVIDGAEFAQCSSELGASRLAARVERVRAAKEGEREALIERELVAQFDPRAAEAALGRFESSTKLLRGVSIALTLFLIALTPLVLHEVGLELSWRWLLAGLLVLHFAAVVVFSRTYRALHAGDRAGWLASLLQVAISPPQAARAIDFAAWPALCDAHPLAAAGLVDDSDRRAIARAVLLDALHPREAPERIGELARRVSAEHRARLAALARKRLAELGLDEASLLAVPSPDDVSRRSFCPRCELQFDVEAALCPECETRARPLAGARVV